MGCVRKLYRLRDCTSGEVVLSGTAAECAEFLGIKEKSFHVIRSHFSGTGERPKSKGYYLEELGRAATLDAEAVRAWDELTEHLRRKYGVPRYVPKEDENG